jgi:hypothetical protein
MHGKGGTGGHGHVPGGYGTGTGGHGTTQMHEGMVTGGGTGAQHQPQLVKEGHGGTTGGVLHRSGSNSSSSSVT